MEACLRMPSGSAPVVSDNHRSLPSHLRWRRQQHASAALFESGTGGQRHLLSSGALKCGPARRRIQPRRAVAVGAAVAEEKPPVVERLEGEDVERWMASVDAVKKLGYEQEEAAAMLERAFGWRTQTFWRGLKKEEVPQPEAVTATLKFMQEEIGMKEPDIKAALKKFPEALASNVEGRLKPNLEYMEKDLYMKQAKQRLMAIKRQPKALGFSYDCEGSCEGECHRCWVRF